MKKLKIFLLLSILLCFGFVLSSEAHAQSNGPKTLEIGDVLPAGKIKISWDFTIKDIPDGYFSMIFGSNDFFIKLDGSIEFYLAINSVDNRFYNLIGDTTITLDTDVTITEFTNSNDYYEYIDGALFWEVVTPGPKVFEVNDVLPAGYIKISWDFTDISFGDDDELWIYLDDIDNPSIAEYIHIYKVVLEYETIILDMYDKEVHADTTGNIIITLTSSYIVDSIQGVGDLPYEYINEALTWEVVSPDYADGYEDGYADAGVQYGLGYEHARETYGYYDPITDQWLSVSEYLNLYGTDKLGQSDFYNNFDKYFIPAMIIVFGGAIVLTILKVFKGRE